MKTYVQIGTKDGNDSFNAYVRETKPDMVILVEPNTEHNSSIYKNYKGIPFNLENIAIIAEDKEMVTLVHPREPKDIYDSGKFSLLPMDDWGKDFVSIEVPAMTFMQLCEKYNIDKIDFLQIDTEGYDTEIIKSIDFFLINIDVIKYEIWHFSPDCFTRHGEKGKTYGTAGMLYVENMLKSLGYDIRYMDYDVIAMKNVASLCP